MKIGEMTLNEIKDRCEKHIESGQKGCTSCPLWIFCMPEGIHEYAPTNWGTELNKEMED